MHDTEDPTRSSAADAAGMAADYSARHTYARGYDDGRKAEKARADAAERMVAEVRAKGWCPVAEREAAIRARDEAVAELTALRATRNPQPAIDTLAANLDRVNDLRHAAERARDEVGIQYAAAQAEIARMKPVVEAARRLLGANDSVSVMTWRINTQEAIVALDTVPGDALAPRLPGVQNEMWRMANARVAELEGLLRDVKEAIPSWQLDGFDLNDRITAALEASGIDTDNVKDGDS